MLILNYFKGNWVTQWKTLFPLVIITHHSKTLTKTPQRLFPTAKLQQWKTLKSKWTCEFGTSTVISGWYTCEFGPSHHAAAIPMTSSLRELYFVPTETNGKARAIWAALTPQSRKGAAYLTASASYVTEHPTALELHKNHTQHEQPTDIKQ